MDEDRESARCVSPKQSLGIDEIAPPRRALDRPARACPRQLATLTSTKIETGALGSINLDPGGRHDRIPLLRFGEHNLLQVLGRVNFRLDAKLAQARP